MKVTDELFSSGILPKGVVKLKGQSLDAAFKIIKNKYAYFNDKEGDELINTHLGTEIRTEIRIKRRKKHSTRGKR